MLAARQASNGRPEQLQVALHPPGSSWRGGVGLPVGRSGKKRGRGAHRRASRCITRVAAKGQRNDHSLSRGQDQALGGKGRQRVPRNERDWG